MAKDGYDRGLRHGEVSAAEVTGEPQAFMCATCGAQYSPSVAPPAGCPICLDDRQYVLRTGQRWTTLELIRQSFGNVFEEHEPGLSSVKTEPKLAVGQSAYLIRTAAGNVLWDCISLLDDETVAWAEERGGVDAIAISHPHYYSSMIEWSRAFGNVPVYVHADELSWVARPDEAVVGFDGEAREIVPGVTAVRVGGHFPGALVLHWAAGAGGRGVLLTADTIQVAADERWLSFLYSYPNMIPLPPQTVERMVARVEGYAFDRIYGAFTGCVDDDAKGALRRSADRYVRAVTFGL